MIYGIDEYTSPAQIQAAAANAAYYNSRPGGMRDWSDEGLGDFDGLGAIDTSSKGLMKLAAGALVGGYVATKVGGKSTMHMGIGAVVGAFLANKFLG